MMLWLLLAYLLLLLLSVAKLALEALDLSVAKKPRFLDELFSFEALILKKQLFFTQRTFYSNTISSSSKMVEALFFLSDYYPNSNRTCKHTLLIKVAKLITQQLISRTL